MITGLRTSPVLDVNTVVSDLEYIADVLGVIIANTEEYVPSPTATWDLFRAFLQSKCKLI